MDTPNTLPEDLKPLSGDDLDGLGQKLEKRAGELRDKVESDDYTDADLDEIDRIAAEKARLTDENDRRTEVQAERTSRAQAGLAKLNGETGDEVTPADDEDDEKVAPTAEETPAEGGEVAVPIAAATEGDATAALTEAAMALAAAAESIAGGESRVATQARTRPRALAALKDKAPTSTRPRPSRASEGFMKASAFQSSAREGSDLDDTKAVAKVIADARLRQGNVPTGISGDRVSMACGTKELDGQMVSPEPGTAGALANFSILRDVVEVARDRARAGARGESTEGLVASGGGGYCNIYTPMYDFYRLAEPQSPIEDDLSTIPAPRAGIQYMQPMDWRTALGAVGTQDKAANEANEVKSFLALECPQILTAEVLAVYQIVQFDNLQYKVNPEQVEAFLEDVAVAFAYTKESFYLSQIADASTTVSGPTPYGARRGLMFDLTTAAVEYRKRNAMKVDSVLKAYLPDWYVPAIQLDWILDHESGEDAANPLTGEQVMAQLRSLNLDVTLYNDLSTNTGLDGIAQAQPAGALNDWPSLGRAYIFSPGSFGRLDAGNLDIGLVRDSVLNGTNDLQMFMEEWLGLAFLGIESIELISTPCISGGAPDFAQLITCT